MTKTMPIIDSEERLTESVEQIRDALSARSTWADKLVFHYRLRHGGLKRPKKPWPGAADMNWPLSDTLIEKIKPYYIQQTFANELVANFFSLRSSDDTTFNLAAAQWFDYRLRQHTNFETEVVSVADYMLMHGKGIMKVRWDEKTKTKRARVTFDAVDPAFFVVPPNTTALADADWCVQIHQFTEAAYRRQQNFDQSVLPQIVEKNTADLEDAKRGDKQEKYYREGITHGSCEDGVVVVWEVFERQDDDSLETYMFSPSLPTSYVVPPRPLPYDHGQLPYVEFNSEIKDKGYYAPRGIPERVQSIQMSLSKLWNEKLDATTVFNRPFFTSDNPLVNAGSITLRPGEIIPIPVKKVDLGTPPINWDVEINSQRLIAEQMIGVPDAGLGGQFSSSERRTAAEVNLIGSIVSQVVDLRSRVFRHALGTVFRQTWALYMQHAKKDVDFFYRNELTQAPPAALHADYEIEPLASADNLNKQFVYQKKVERFQMLAGNEFVNQSHLVRDLIAAGDPQDVKSLHMDGDSQSTDAMEDQAGEISRMLIGFPSQVKPVDRDDVHLTVLNGFVERRVQTKEVISPELARLLMNHANMHFRQFQQKDPASAAQLEPDLQKLAAYLGRIVGVAEAAQQAAQQAAGPPQSQSQSQPQPQPQI